MNLDVDAAIERAASKLSRSDKLSGEIAIDLASKGFPPEVVTEAIARLTRAGVINDLSVIQRRILAAVRKGNASRAVIALKLEAQGADAHDIQSALDEHFPEVLEQDLIRNILKKKYHQTEPPQKAGRYLAGLGFDPSMIESELSRFFDSNAP